MLRSDRTIKLKGPKSKQLYPDTLRMVEYNDDKKDLLLIFIINNLEVSSLEIARSYSNHWQIEVFFKWIKQNLTVKTLWGHSDYVVKVHVWSAICTYLIVAQVKYALKSTLSIYEIMQFLGLSVFDKSPVKELLTESQIKQNFKEQVNLVSTIY